jgi:tetratricopeptide repeat protein
MASRSQRWASAVALLLALPTLAAASPASDALSLCRQADSAPDVDKRALLGRGVAAAEAALAADEHDAAAHFALFCNLGKRMRLDGASLASLFALRRLRREIDRTLELAPTNADALVGKAALLRYMPRVVGGDPVEGERLLRVALDVAPDYVDARVALARLLRDQGHRDEARVTASRALHDATRTANAAAATDARRLLSDLGQ